MDGYDPAYGVRPLRRLIQREIGDKLARMLLSGEATDGATVTVDTDPSDSTQGLTLTAQEQGCGWWPGCDAWSQLGRARAQLRG